MGNFVGVLHVTRFQQKRPWLNGRQDLSQTVDCRGCGVYWMSDIVWSASPPLIDQAGNFNLKQQSNYLKTSTNFRTRTFLFDLLNVTRTVYLQSTKKPKNQLKVKAKSTKIYLLPNQQCYDCLLCGLCVAWGGEIRFYYFVIIYQIISSSASWRFLQCLSNCCLLLYCLFLGQKLL